MNTHDMPGRSADPTTIVFFGLGAVGSSMLICFDEIAERDGVPVRFLVFSIDVAGAQDALFHAEHLLDRVELVEVADFAPIFAGDPGHLALLEGAVLLVNAATPAFNAPILELAIRVEVADFAPIFAGDPGHLALLEGAVLLVNAATPAFNAPILELAIRVGAHALDLASDMYEPETERTRTFAQYRYHDALSERGVAAMINFGISPGITNFLIGEHIHHLRATGRKDLKIESIDLYLLEDIDADAVIFSWAPTIALEELSQQPYQLRFGRMQRLHPFDGARIYEFPHELKPVRQYPLYQEELLSLHRAFPEIPNIGVYTGGSEVELVKALYQLNLLSRDSIAEGSGLTVEEVVRAVLPGMKKPRRIEEYLRNGTIRRAHFCAAAEIRTSESVRNERQTLVETVGLSYLRYRGLLDTPYAGATYISYPTAVGAAILAWQLLEHCRETPGSIRGIVSGEDLAVMLPRPRIDAVRRDLAAWDIDLFESVRDAFDD